MAPQQLGVTVAFLNCINMLGGSFFHTIIGKVMDLYWTGSIDNEGIRIYSLDAFQYALGIVPICAVTGAMMVFALSIMLERKRLRVSHHNAV